MAKVARLVLLDHGPVDWQLPLIAEHAVIDPTDQQSLVRHARMLAARHDLDGVVTYEESLVVPAARLAAELGVPSMPVAGAEACRDKLLQRRLLAAQHIPAPMFRLVHDVEEARQAATEIGYPVVLKQRGLVGSVGVSRVDDTGQLEDAYRDVSAATTSGLTSEPGLLVEELLTGPEYTVDCAVAGGQARVLSVAGKTLAHPPHFVEVEHIVGIGTAAPAQLARLGSVACDASLALGVDRAVTHVELRLTPTGPRVVEVNGRTGGNLVPRLAELAGGPNAGAALARAALGILSAASSAELTGAAGVRFLFPDEELVFNGLDCAADLATQPWIEDLRALRSPGELAVPAPASFWGSARVVVTGADAGQVSERLAYAAAGIRITGTPTGMRS
jgi:biotin carboxylase